jgi:hypothetical protein
MVQDNLAKKRDPISEITTTGKAGGMTQAQSTCLASVKPFVQTPAPPNQKTTKHTQ